MPVWAVTGGSGFLGRHVLAALADADAEVVALGRRCPLWWPAHAFVRADLDDRSSLVRALSALRPSIVVHLAGQTPPARPEQYFAANTRATVHLIESVRTLNQRVRVVVAGSAAELGAIESHEAPLSEGTRCRPFEPYGLSKWFAAKFALAAAEPLEVMVARVFNPIGPGMSSTQAFGRFAATLAETGPDPVRLVVGDLSSRRDFVDVRDVADAFLAIALRGRSGLVYHVGTGLSHSVGEGLEELIRLSGRATILESPRGDVGSRGELGSRGPRNSRADVGRISEHTGWSPSIAWKQSLADLWDEVRARTRLPLTIIPTPL
jgi:nucleoside-diphosphate-sugar epimerase